MMQPVRIFSLFCILKSQSWILRKRFLQKKKNLSKRSRELISSSEKQKPRLNQIITALCAIERVKGYCICRSNRQAGKTRLIGNSAKRETRHPCSTDRNTRGRRVRHVSDRWLVLAGGEGGPGHPHAELRIAFIHPDRGASVTGLSLMSAPASLLRIFSFEFGSIWQLAIAGDLGFNCLGGVNCFAFERITPRRPEIRAKCYC